MKKKNIKPAKSAQISKQNHTIAKPLAENTFNWKVYIPYGLIAVLCTGIYIQSIHFGFTGLDDNFFIITFQTYFSSFNYFWHGFAESAVMDYYRPLLFGSFMVDAHFSGIDPSLYHISNIVFHLLSCWALYKMLIKLGYEQIFALLSTLVFTAHPLFTMAVAWVPGRNDPMITMLILGSFNFLLDYIKERKVIHLILHWVLYTMALFTKEPAALFPVLCLFYFLVLTDWKQKIRPIMILGTGWAIIGMIWFAIRKDALYMANKNGTRFTTMIFGDAWLKNIADWPEHIGKFTAPFNLTTFPKFSTFSTVLGIVAIVAWIVFLVLAKNRNNRIILFFCTWLFLFFAPATTFVFADSGRYDYLEHRFHLPAIALIVLLNELIKSYFYAGNRQLHRKYAIAILGCVIMAFSVQTVLYSRNFSDALAFWKKAKEGAPQSSQVFRGLGVAYMEKGDFKNAETTLERAIFLNKAEVNTMSGLGRAYENKGDLDGAERCFKRTVEVDSNQLVFIADLARVYERKKDYVKAEKWYSRAIILNPQFWEAKFSLGILAYLNNKFAESERYWLDVIKINPAHNDTYMNLAVLYFNLQKIDKSLQYIQILKDKGVDVAQLNPGLINSLRQYKGKV